MPARKVSKRASRRSLSIEGEIARGLNTRCAREEVTLPWPREPIPRQSSSAISPDSARGVQPSSLSARQCWAGNSSQTLSPRRRVIER